MLKSIGIRLLKIVQLILVLGFILFEEIVWEGIAKPIYDYVHALKLLLRLEAWVQRIPGWLVLILFVLLLTSVEMLGVYAGILALSGHPVAAAGIYLTKIPIAAFTFWLFRVSEAKLMRYAWFRYLYERAMALIAKLKATELYQNTMQRLHALKAQIKGAWQRFKARYVAKESGFMQALKRYYRTMKRIVGRE